MFLSPDHFSAEFPVEWVMLLMKSQSSLPSGTDGSSMSCLYMAQRYVFSWFE